MSRDQLAEHLRFASELGVAGVSRDPAWRARGDRVSTADEPSASDGDIDGTESVAAQAARRDTHSESSASASQGDGAPLAMYKSAADALVGVRTEIGDCVR